MMQGLRPKSIDFYDLKREMFVGYKVNIPDFLAKLDAEIDENQQIFERKPSSRLISSENPKLIDPVIDPRESWSDMFWRVSEFKPPPLVDSNY